MVPRANVFSADCEFDAADPAGYRSGVARVGQEAGGEALVVKVFELPPGEAVCPYHYEYEEEGLVVLDGAGGVCPPPGASGPGTRGGRSFLLGRGRAPQL